MKISYLWSKFFIKIRGKSLRGSNIHKTSFVNSGCNVVNSNIGRYTYLGYDCWVTEAEIGAFCSISNNVRIGGAAHPMEFVSTSPVFHKGKNVLDKNFSEHEFEPFKRTTVGNDVWIGENSIVKAGITIGNGAVIGTGSVKICYACGVNFSKQILEDYLDVPVTEYMEYKEGQYLRYLHTDVLWFVKSPDRFKCKPSWFDFRRSVDQIWSFKDPWPWVTYTISGFLRSRAMRKSISFNFGKGSV